MPGEGVNINRKLEAFRKFANEAVTAENGLRGKTICKLGSHSAEVVNATDDAIHFWRRGQVIKDRNNETRRAFFEAVVAQFGGNIENVPTTVRRAMLMNDYGVENGVVTSGKPLSARRIIAVIEAIDKYTKATPENYGENLFQNLKFMIAEDKEQVGEYLKKVFSDFTRDHFIELPLFKRKEVNGIMVFEARAGAFISGMDDVVCLLKHPVNGNEFTRGIDKLHDLFTNAQNKIRDERIKRFNATAFQILEGRMRELAVEARNGMEW